MGFVAGRNAFYNETVPQHIPALPERTMIRILIADDHAMVRGGLKQLLSMTPDIRVAGEAASGTQVMDLLRGGQFDLVVIDLAMPGFSGIDLITRIRAYEEKLPILVLSMCNETQVIRRALNAGATGYLTKDNEPEALITAIRRTAGGHRFLDPLLVERMVFSPESADGNSGLERLSNREFHILRLLVRGKTVNEIAEELSISNKTISTHKARLMQKMNFRSNAELLKFGMAHGLGE
jgi:DNA-binding NarL/FixJ family response regulator